MNETRTRGGLDPRFLLLIPAVMIIAKAGRRRRAMMEHGWTESGAPAATAATTGSRGPIGETGLRAFRSAAADRIRARYLAHARPRAVRDDRASRGSRDRDRLSRSGQYAASLRIPSAIFSASTMNQSSRTWLYGTPGTSGPAIRVTGPSR